MIKNEREYRITKAQADKFEQAVSALGAAAGGGSPLHPRLRAAERQGIQSQLDELREQLAEYDAAR